MKEFDDFKKSHLYQSASLADQIQMAVDYKHFSLDSGCDANVELFNHLMPTAVVALKNNEREIQSLKSQNEVMISILNKMDCECGYDTHDGYQDTAVCYRCEALDKVKEMGSD